jgi:hypothetical protein
VAAQKNAPPMFEASWSGHRQSQKDLVSYAVPVLQRALRAPLYQIANIDRKPLLGLFRGRSPTGRGEGSGDWKLWVRIPSTALPFKWW